MNKTRIDLIKTLSDLAKDYDFGESGIIRNPGKFEGESLETLYFYDCYLNGGETVFSLTEDEIEVLGLNPKYPFVYLAESNDGFVSLEFYESLADAEARDYFESEEME